MKNVNLSALQEQLDRLEGILDDPDRLAKVALLRAKGVPETVTQMCRDLAVERSIHWVGITLVDDRFQHVMTSSGEVVPECAREDGHCQYVIGSGSPLALSNLEASSFWSRLHRNVVGGGIMNAYLGVPLYYEGAILGAACAVDVVPRTWSAQDHDALVQLAGKTVDLLTAR